MESNVAAEPFHSPQNDLTGGFNREYPVRMILLRFMGLEPGTQVSRADAQRAIRKYIRDNNLSNSEVIYLDDTLKTLLRSQGPLTYNQTIDSMQWLFPNNRLSV
jgi:hypothetical protein